MKKIKLEIEEGKLNIELQAGDKILVESLYGRKKGYIFKNLSLFTANLIITVYIIYVIYIIPYTLIIHLI